MVDFRVELKGKRELISARLSAFFDEKRVSWSLLNRWGPDSLDRLLEYTLRGKMLRGALVLWTASFFGKDDDDALEVACAIELVQSALLIHDDIMDRDALRRGLPSLHKQYESLGAAEGVVDPVHFGVSQAICLGDLSLFLAYELVSRAKVSRPASLSRLFSELVGVVGLGQMQDVYFGHAVKVPSEEDILSMYEHKTATYTFSLPFLLGALIGGVANGDLAAFDDFGKLLGKIFQLKDDELGLFSSDAQLGKTVGIDILTGKKTVFYALLVESMSVQERDCLKRVQSSGVVDESSLSFVRGLLEKYSLRVLVERKIAVLAADARRSLAVLPLPDQGKSFLESLLVYNLERER